MPYICPTCKGSRVVDVAGFGEFGKWDKQPCPRCFGLENSAMTREKAEDLHWGTYGLEAIENNAIHGTPLPAIQQKRLGELEDDHLKRILTGGGGTSVDDEYRAAIILILKARIADREDEASGRNLIRRRDAVEATKARLNDEVV